jgi:hypothetical protein
MNHAQKYLAQANRHIAELNIQIVRQRVIIKDALDTGHRFEMAESLLTVRAAGAGIRNAEAYRRNVLSLRPHYRFRYCGIFVKRCRDINCVLSGSARPPDWNRRPRLATRASKRHVMTNLPTPHLPPGSVPPIRREQKKAPAIFAEALRYRGVSTRRAVVL